MPSRARIHYQPASTSSGGGGSVTVGLVEWGPNFGEPQEMTIKVSDLTVPTVSPSAIIDSGETITMPEVVMGPRLIGTVGENVRLSELGFGFASGTIRPTTSFTAAAVANIRTIGASTSMSDASVAGTIDAGETIALVHISFLNDTDLKAAFDTGFLEAIYQTPIDLATSAKMEAVNWGGGGFTAVDLGGTASLGTYQRNYSLGADVATQTAVAGRSDWTNLTNAQGVNNSTNASITGNALGARSGRLDLAYPNIPDWTTFGFTFVSSSLNFYASQTGTVLNNATSGLTYQYNIGAGIVTLDGPFTGNVTHAPQTYNMTSIINTSAEVDALTVHVPITYQLGVTATGNVDAVILGLVVTHNP